MNKTLKVKNKNNILHSDSNIRGGVCPIFNRRDIISNHLYCMYKYI